MADTVRCLACGREASECIFEDEDESPAGCCIDCRRRYPASLLKAVSDNPFDYACKLATGETVRFSGALIRGDWVELSGVDGPNCSADKDYGVEGLRFPCPRGVDVRIDHIIWCADAPEGS